MLQTVKRTTYHVENTAVAKEWYQTLLNREPVFESPFVTMFQLGESSLTLMQGEPCQLDGYTGPLTYWGVDSVAATLDTLIELGATEHHPIKSVMGTESASVIDPFGNTLGITGPAPKVESTEGAVSETAMAVAMTRVLSTFDNRVEIQGADTMAHLFLSEQYLLALKTEESRTWSKDKVGAFYGTMVARTAYVDQLFCQALLEKRPQIVLLGAGYDTRAYRFEELNSTTNVFEVDLAPTQKRKRQILEKTGIGTSSVEYVAVDFQNNLLLEKLEKSGYDASKETLFLWEGVTCYLPQIAIENTLFFIKNYAAPNSLLFFDYLTEEQTSFYKNEPFIFWMEREGIESLLSEYGLTTIDHITPSLMEEHFLTLEDGTIAEKAIPFFSFILGKKKE